MRWPPGQRYRPRDEARRAAAFCFRVSGHPGLGGREGGGKQSKPRKMSFLCVWIVTKGSTVEWINREMRKKSPTGPKGMFNAKVKGIIHIKALAFKNGKML